MSQTQASSFSVYLTGLIKVCFDKLQFKQLGNPEAPKAKIIDITCTLNALVTYSYSLAGLKQK